MEKSVKQILYLKGEVLFLSGIMNQKEIASYLCVTERTVYKWVKKGNWNQKKKDYDELVGDILTSTLYSIKTLSDKITLENRFPTTGEADTLNKLIKVAKEVDSISIPLIIYSLNLFMDHIANTDHNFNEKIRGFHVSFLAELTTNSKNLNKSLAMNYVPQMPMTL